MKQKIYIETSVISYLVSVPSKDIVIAGHQMATRDMWNTIDNYDIYISDIVIQEVSKGDKRQSSLRLEAIDSFKILEIDDESKKIANGLLVSKTIPEECPEDALHIAVAAANGIDIIVTWNFKHINNPFTRMMTRQVIENMGYICPELCSPDEFLGEEV